jgi:hypothetical protein
LRKKNQDLKKEDSCIQSDVGEMSIFEIHGKLRRAEQTFYTTVKRGKITLNATLGIDMSLSLHGWLPGKCLD